MNILVLNGSPKGQHSITLQTALYLEQIYKAHNFSYLHVGQKIRAYEHKFQDVIESMEQADLILFVYPVYTFLAPYQLHHFIELMKEATISLEGKYVSQITTSKHFYDITAHKFIEENAYDFGARFIRGLSADMEDLLEEKGRTEAICYFDKLLFDIENGIYQEKKASSTPYIPTAYKASFTPVPKNTNKDIVLITNLGEQEDNLKNMIDDFIAICESPVRVINLREFSFSGGCLGCFHCSTTGTCIYKDGFDSYLRDEIQTADAIIYAYTIQNHYTQSSLKCYDDRQFCNGHRTVNHGMPVGYLISGNYENEQNVKTIVEARSEVSGMYLCGVATDEENVTSNIKRLATSLQYALTHEMKKSANFYGVGGTKIFRDLVFLMRGMMKADHQYYKKNGIYDYPHNKRFKIIQMQIIGTLLMNPSVRKKLKGSINSIIVTPYTKIIEEAGK
ncbi:MAG: NAD(P)H-dependent oxidoreductase [Eubacteriales bacterium]